MHAHAQAGLMADKTLKYAYQLADVMHFLQQRGVVHQNLLPENIQVWPCEGEWSGGEEEMAVCSIQS